MEQWKDLIYQEVIDYERTHNTLGPGGTPARSGAGGAVGGSGGAAASATQAAQAAGANATAAKEQSAEDEAMFNRR